MRITVMIYNFSLQGITKIWSMWYALFNLLITMFYYVLTSFMQTNPFDLFEAFFGANMGNFSSMDQSTFRTRGRSSAVKGEDIRWVYSIIWSVRKINPSWIMVYSKCSYKFCKCVNIFHALCDTCTPVSFPFDVVSCIYMIYLVANIYMLEIIYVPITLESNKANTSLHSKHLHMGISILGRASQRISLVATVTLLEN